MTIPAIRVDNLSKVYRVNRNGNGGGDLREALTSLVKAPLHRLRHGPAHGVHSEEFWALKDVSFEVQPGEILGVIGANGAGKSTLLKILSHITEPTNGRVEIRGRVACLLEVGTGFHPELSGRENVYLNGAILGMSKREIDRKFDEIVDFSGVENFLDTPVKRYSSGMRVRLGFAVAAHLDPEILIVDEVLAVGDAEFQNRCLGKMNDVAKSGRTVLFVSHNMAAVESICRTGFQLQQGEVVASGTIDAVLDQYRRHAYRDLTEESSHQQFAAAQFIKFATLLDTSGNPTNFIPLGSELRLQISIHPHHCVRSPKIGVGIDSLAGQRVLTVHTPPHSDSIRTMEHPCNVICRIPNFPLAPGRYSLKIALTDIPVELEALESVVPFSVVDSQAFDEGMGFHRGQYVAPSEWRQVFGEIEFTTKECDAYPEIDNAQQTLP